VAQEQDFIIRLYYKTLCNWKTLLPILQEQIKIAAFLSSVDKKLNKLRDKHKLLETYKRGIMQKIFSQELRFKQENGSNFPDWEKKKMNNIFGWVRTNSYSREKLTNISGEIQNIHYGDIHTKYSVHFDQKIADAPYIIEPDISKIIPKTDFCREGDLVIADASEDYLDIGKTIEIISVKPNSLVSGLHTYIARPKIDLYVGFSAYLFQSEIVRKQIKRIAQGISVLGVSKTNLEKVNLPYPQPEEQKKIADFLSAIDKKIKMVSDKIKQVETFKKGLLQKMFV